MARFKYTVKQGDSIFSIAYRFNILPETIWDDPANAELKGERTDSSILFPGDVLEFRGKEMEEVSISTGQRHKFRVKGFRQTLRLQLIDEEGDPYANEAYVLDIDGDVSDGNLDDGGWLDVPVPPNARQAVLTLTDVEEEYIFQIGKLDPIDTISGIQARLNNLGYDCGPVNGQLNQQTERALRIFQAAHDLPVTGSPDEKTLKALQEEHGN